MFCFLKAWSVLETRNKNNFFYQKSKNMKQFFCCTEKLFEVTKTGLDFQGFIC